MSSPLSPPFDRIHTSPLSPPYDRIDPSIERRKQPTEHEKIVSLMGGVAVLSVCGMIYGFASYADAIKKQKHFSDSQISTLSSASNLGFCVGPHIGWFVDRYGPRAAAFCAAVSAGIAYAATGWLLVSSQSMMAVMTVLFILLGQGSMCAYMAAIVTYKNFEPSNRGKVIGLLDGTFGLSAALFSIVYDTCFNGSADPNQQHVGQFFIFVACCMAIVNILAGLVIKIPVNQGVADVCTGEAVAMIDPAGDLHEVPMLSERVPLEQTFKASNLQFGVLFAVFTILNTNALLFIDNVSFMNTALHQEHLTSTVTVIWPIASAVSRVLSGTLSDSCEKRLSKVGLLCLAAIAMTGINLLMVFELQLVVLSSVVVGSSFGATWCLTPLILDHYFGSEGFGLNWSTIMIGSGVGGFLLVPVKDAVYNAHLLSPNADDCYGIACYQITLVVNTSLAFMSVILLLWLGCQWKTKTQML